MSAVAPHRWLSIVGLTSPRAKAIEIECSCHHIASGETYAAASVAHELHKIAPGAPIVPIAEDPSATPDVA